MVIPPLPGQGQVTIEPIHMHCRGTREKDFISSHVGSTVGQEWLSSEPGSEEHVM